MAMRRASPPVMTPPSSPDGDTGGGTRAATPERRSPPSLESLASPRDQLSKKTFGKLEAAYRAADDDGDPSELTFEQVKSFLKTQKVEADEEFLDDCLAQYDLDGNGTINLGIIGSLRSNVDCPVLRLQ